MRTIIIASTFLAFLIGTISSLDTCSKTDDCPMDAACVKKGKKKMCVCNDGFEEDGGECYEIEYYDGDDNGDDGDDGGDGAGDGNNGNNGDVEDIESETTTEQPRPTPRRPRTTTEKFVPPEFGIRINRLTKEEMDYNDTVTRCPDLYLAPSRNSEFCYHGGQCLRDPILGRAYCVCDKHFGGRFCNNRLTKPSSNNWARPRSFGSASQQVFTENNMKYKHKHVDDASTFGRRYADSIFQCLDMCRKAGQNCYSVNYGRIGNSYVCELLNVRAKRDSRLHKWLVNKPGWRYACCVN